MIEPFLIRAIIAGIGVAIITGAIGCFVVWRRMAYFGDSLAHSALLGVALGLVLGISTNLGTMIICSVFAILLLAGLLGIPKDPIEAAKVDGCNSWQVFKNITLPFLMPFVFIAMTIRSLDVARAYDIVQMMTGGGPAKRTELLWTLISRTGYVDAKMGMANAMSYISIFLSIAFTFFLFYKLVEARQRLSYE